MSVDSLKAQFKAFGLTEWLIAANVIMFLGVQIIDLTGQNGLFLLGSKVNILIAFGEIWRLVTSMFLHADIMHLVFNMLMLYVIGRDIERFYGRSKFIVIYLVGGLIGSLASYVFTTNNAVGASGAIFGLMGANLYLLKLNPAVYKRLYGMDFVLLIAFNLVIGIIRPNIDMAGHVGGLIGGYVLAVSLGLSYEKWFTAKKWFYPVIALLLIVGQAAYGTYLVKSDVQNHISAAYYYNEKGDLEKAERILLNAQEKFNP